MLCKSNRDVVRFLFEGIVPLVDVQQGVRYVETAEASVEQDSADPLPPAEGVLCAEQRNAILVRSPRFYDRVVRKGEIGFGEAYVDGDWESDDVQATIRQIQTFRPLIETRLRSQLATLFWKGVWGMLLRQTDNDVASARKNIEAHYDLGNDLYERMLGRTMAYSCGYYHRPDMTLDEAQIAKFELVAQKLDLRPGMKVLDIGCGFGTAAVHMATHYGVKVVGVTLSAQQLEWHAANGGHENVTVLLKDYRDLTGVFEYDRIYSIGAFEHIGKKRYAEFFGACQRLLKQDGILLLHTIGSVFRGVVAKDWITTYIFPGAELPHVSHFTERYTDEWMLQDYQNFGLSYKRTLDAWASNLGDWSSLPDAYDSVFRRTWHYYLSACAASFDARLLNLNQLVYYKALTSREDDAHHARGPLREAGKGEEGA